MATSKVAPEDAQEWLETLQQVGEGWYRQVGLAVKMGAPKALGLERREFTALIGQRLIDPREAIVQLHEEGHSQAAIADVLHVSHRTVQGVLIEGDLIAAPDRDEPKQIAAPGRVSADTTAEDLDELTHGLEDEVKQLEAQLSEADATRKAEIAVEVEKLVEQLRAADEKRRLDLEAEVERLSTLTTELAEERKRAVKGEQEKSERATEKLKEKVDDLAKRGVKLTKELKDAKKGELDTADRERIEKEQEARLAEIEASFAPVYLQAASEKIAGATDELREAVQLGITSKHNKDLARIEKNFEALNNELVVAQAMAGQEVTA
jgi:hypothetical protein